MLGESILSEVFPSFLALRYLIISFLLPRYLTMDFVKFSAVAGIAGILPLLFPSNSSHQPTVKSSKNTKKKHQKQFYSVKMHWILILLTFFTTAISIIVFSPSLQQSSSQFPNRKSPVFLNAPDCNSSSLVHVAITLDDHYLRGSIAAVHSILRHSTCPENISFHFIVSDRTNLSTVIQYIFPKLKFTLYKFDSEKVQTMISSSVREALEQPLNYARNYLADLLEPSIHKVIYLDSDLLVVDDIFNLWNINLGKKTIGAPEYCHTNFTKYFTASFWSDPGYSSVFSGRKPCYFNTGVMVMDLDKWRRVGYTKQIEKWMRIQKMNRIYELGSLPPFLLVFAGHVAPIDHRWNKHGLGGDNFKGSCRQLHPGPVSLLHWSGSGKPWLRLDSMKSCTIDHQWLSYDLHENSTVILSN